MNIIEALVCKDIRITSHYSERWLVADNSLDNGIIFTVYERKKWARNTTQVLVTEIEEEAVKELLNEKEESEGDEC